MNAVTLATFNELEPAQHLQKRLQEAGLKAVVEDESNQEKFWYLSEPLAAIHVGVEPEQYGVALERLHEWEPTDPLLGKALHCPACRSSQIEYPQLTRKFLLPSLGALLMRMKIIPRHFYCCACHYTWPPAQQPPEPARDILGWPQKSKLWHPENKPPPPP